MDLLFDLQVIYALGSKRIGERFLLIFFFSYSAMKIKVAFVL